MTNKNEKDVKHALRNLADKYAKALKQQVDVRVKEMKDDDKSHFLIYRVLGITVEEGELIDVYQNKGRFLYKYAGSFLEEAAKICFRSRYPEAASARIPNTLGKRPATFEIDCVIEKDAIEVKWRDATTDGDHITKEHTRLKTIADAGYTPIRVMFYYPNREQAIRIQTALETLYKGANGQYYEGAKAWAYIKKRTGIDLLAILTELADRK